MVMGSMPMVGCWGRTTGRRRRKGFAEVAKETKKVKGIFGFLSA
jgi:hypothetical protein